MQNSFGEYSIQVWDNYYEIQKGDIFNFLSANPIYFWSSHNSPKAGYVNKTVR